MHLWKVWSLRFSLQVCILCIFVHDMISGQTLDDSVDKCVQEALTSRPELNDRFDPGLLKVACRKRVQWNKMAVNGLAKSAKSPLLTPNQVAWADKLFQCFDQRCMCQMFDQCMRELTMADPGGFGNIVNRTTRQINKRSMTNFDRARGHPRGPRAISQVDKLLSEKIGKATRKEIRKLTDEERRRFFAALQRLKTENIDTLSKYDIMIVQHTAEYSPGAHFSASFLPFHREFSKNLEMALRAVDPYTALPYWDPTLDQGLPDPRDSILWTEDFLGNGAGDVVTGPFASWTTVTDTQFRDLSPNKRIVRNIGVSPYGSLYRDTDLEAIMTRRRFRDLVYCVDPFFELVHGANHLWMGGHMNELRISPNDPIFFLLHGFVDYVWEEWRQNNQNADQRVRDYVNTSETCNQFAQPQEKMRPYTIKNIDGLSNQYVDVLYSYEPRPLCSSAKPDCGSPYLFCHTDRSKCLSKITGGGNCTGLDRFESCWTGNCVNGKCVSNADKDSAAGPGPNSPQPTAPARKPTSADRQNVVWVPVTVISLNGRTGAGFSNAKIVTTMDSSSEKLSGIVADPSEKPYYTGSALAQVTSPFAPGQSGLVRAKVEVFDDSGRKCAGMCQERGTTYNPCDVSFSLTATSQQADGVAFAQTLALAKRLNWQGDKHLPDRYLFMCPTGKSKASPGTAPTGNEVVPTTMLPRLVPRPVTPTFSISTNGEDSSKSGNGDIVIKVIHSTDSGATKPPMPNTGTVGAPPGGASTSGAESASQEIDDCTNDHRCCPIWAAVGECNRNPWMTTACRKICGVCTSKRPLSRICIDQNPKCQTWASNGQCDTNDLWMEENCKKSCDVCDRSLGELKSLCGAAPNRGGCVDQDSRCIGWSKEWECTNNPWWMKENCPEACNYCNARVV